MKLFIAPYKIGSESAKTLAQALPCKQTKSLKRFIGKTLVVNWGRSDLTVRGRNVRILNSPDAVKRAINKLECLTTLKANNVSCLEFTTNKNEAHSWILEEGATVYCRTLVSASQGRGIVIANENSDVIPSAPLYTKGVLRAHEYRVHVFKGQVLDFSKKKRRRDFDGNDLIKNLANGWVFCRDGVVLPELVKETAIKAIAALGLDFGAIDILFKERDNKSYVLEVNTAAGIQGTTLEKYKQAILMEANR